MTKPPQRIQSVKAAVAAELEADPLREFFTWWDTVSDSDVSEIQEAIDLAKREEDVRQFLQENPKFLIQHLGGGHGRWVIPKARLGANHVTDFLIAERHSFGFGWQAVELESPHRRMSNKNGDPSRHLNHALRQITDWRAWLKANQSYAARPRDEGGLGLTDIDANVRGVVFISAKYSFTRNDGRSGFLRTSTVNTDARNALADWANAHSNRSFEVIHGDDDDELVALLAFREHDHEAGADLDRACDAHGVRRGTFEAGRE